MKSEKSVSTNIDSKTEAVLKKKNYKILQQINHGSYGQVYKGVRLNTNELVAIKMIELSKQSKLVRSKYVPREIAVLMVSRHENIIRIYDIIRSNNRLYIFMEFASNGDLAGYARKNGPMSSHQAKVWFVQVLNALIYVHSTLRIAHRDIKLDNVLLDSSNTAKLSDFGFAKQCWNSKRHCVTLSETICGTFTYFSPQILSRVPYNAYLSDVWAMGVMLFFMLNNRFPFSSENPQIMLLEQTNYPNLLKSRFLSKINDDAIDLIVRFLDPNEKTRITLHEALDHPWILSSNTKA